MTYNSKKKLIVAVSGASGAIYAQLLFERLAELSEQISEVGVVFSDTAKAVWQHELGNRNFEQLPYPIYAPNNYFAPFASGSAQYDSMLICPCSMGTLARIATGISDSLITRAADVMLKERRKLILLTRDMPLNQIQIQNMLTLTQAGSIICPASPAFYSGAKSIRQLALTVVDRILDLADFQIDTFRWQGV